MPSTIYLITGGTRSGKSSYAQKLCERICENPVYLATSKAWDDDFRNRIRRHRQDRGEKWTTVEEPLNPSKYVGNAEEENPRQTSFVNRVVLVDCLTLWLTNYFVQEGAFTEEASSSNSKEKEESTTAQQQEAGGDSNNDETGAPDERALRKIKEEFELLIKPWNVTYVFVTNELGSGTHASTHMSRKFVDAHGWLNQHVASRANCVVQMVCGIPNAIKELPKQGSDGRNPRSNCCSNDKRFEAKMLDRFLSGRGLQMDEKGYFTMKIDPAKCVIVASFHSCILNDKGEVCDMEGNKIPCCGDKNNRPEPMKTWECRTAKELTTEIFEKWEYAPQAVTVGHAAYIGREAQKAEQCLYSGEHYQQD